MHINYLSQKNATTNIKLNKSEQIRYISKWLIYALSKNAHQQLRPKAHQPHQHLARQANPNHLHVSHL